MARDEAFLLKNVERIWIRQTFYCTPDKQIILLAILDVVWQEASILEELHELINEKIKPNLGKPIKNHELFNASVLNVIWALVAGERFKLDDERLAELIHFVTV